jgi:hypothetical protein
LLKGAIPPIIEILVPVRPLASGQPVPPDLELDLARYELRRAGRVERLERLPMERHWGTSRSSRPSTVFAATGDSRICSAASVSPDATGHLDLARGPA